MDQFPASKHFFHESEASHRVVGSSCFKLGMPLTPWPYSRLPLLWMWKSCLHVAHIFPHDSSSAGVGGSGVEAAQCVRWLVSCRYANGGGKGHRFDVNELYKTIPRTRVAWRSTVDRCFMYINTDCSLSFKSWKMYEIWKQFNQIWLDLSLIQDILCVCLRRYFLYVTRMSSRQWWLTSFLSFTNKEQLPQTVGHNFYFFIQGECYIYWILTAYI